MRNTFVIALVVSLALVAGAPAGAQAQAPEAWTVTVAPYLMGAAMSGTVAVAGQELDVDMSASDIFSNLQFGAMGLVVARKGNWGVGGLEYCSQPHRLSRPRPCRVAVRADFRTWVIENAA